MRGLKVAPALSLLSSLGAASWRPLQTFVRTTEERWRPSRIVLHRAIVVSSQAALLGRPALPADHAAIVHFEKGAGRVPTIVLGGLVPDSTEQVFLLRRFLLKSGDVYYVNYLRTGFSLDLLCAQLSDLVTELEAQGRPPVVFGVSFGAGVLMEWLRRARMTGSEPTLAGIVLVSPVTCIEDLITPGAMKASTLVGRAVKPFLEAKAEAANATAVEKGRAIFLRMFEAGAQNKEALRVLMTRSETLRLRNAVQATIRGLSAQGAYERVQALKAMRAPTEYFNPLVLPLASAPTLILFAEREDAVLTEGAPVRFALERAAGAYFTRGTVRCVAARPGEAPVQHASLVFHAFEFLAPLQAFYQSVRRSRLALAA